MDPQSVLMQANSDLYINAFNEDFDMISGKEVRRASYVSTTRSKLGGR